MLHLLPRALVVALEELAVLDRGNRSHADRLTSQREHNSTDEREEQRLDVIARGEAGEREIDRFIERQAQRTGADEANAIEAMWRASERAHAAKQRKENRSAWIAHYRGLTAAHLKMALDCRRRARELEATEGRTA